MGSFRVASRVSKRAVKGIEPSVPRRQETLDFPEYAGQPAPKSGAREPASRVG